MKTTKMTSSPFEAAVGQNLTFEDVQRMNPAYQEYVNHVQKFRVKGAYIGGSGFAVFAGCLAATVTSTLTSAMILTDASSFDWSKGHQVFLWYLMGLGFLTMITGSAVFAYGQVRISRAYRSFDEVMKPLIAAQIAEEKINKENGHN